jgi:hypothetical protein
MGQQVKKAAMITTNLLWWLPVASIWIMAWGKNAEDFSPSAVETAEISFRVRDAYLFSLPLLLEREPGLASNTMENQGSGDDYQAFKTLLEWNADTYFQQLNALLDQDEEKSRAFRSLSSLGIGAGQEFSLSMLPMEKIQAIQAGYAQGQAALLDDINQYRQDPLGSRPACGLGMVQAVCARQRK